MAECFLTRSEQGERAAFSAQVKLYCQLAKLAARCARVARTLHWSRLDLHPRCSGLPASLAGSSSLDTLYVLYSVFRLVVTRLDEGGGGGDDEGREETTRGDCQTPGLRRSGTI